MESTPIEFTIVVLALLFSFAEQGNDGRTSPYNMFGNSSYTFHKNSSQYRNWEGSRKRCKEIGSDLVSIESEKEWSFLKKAIQEYATGEYFIGLRNVSKSKEWRWISDNSKVNATKGEFPWAKNNPSGDGKCAVMYKDYLQDYGLFNDLSCTHKTKIPGYICESSVNNNDQEVPAVKPTSYRTESKRKGSVRKTTLRRSLAATSAALLTTSNSPSAEAPSKATPPKNVKDVPIKDIAKDNTKVIIIVLTLLAFLILMTLIVFYVMCVRRRNFKKQVQSRARCTYEKPSPGQQSGEHGRHLGSSAAEVAVHVKLSRTEAGRDTHEIVGDQEGPTYANVKQTNRNSQTHREDSLTHEDGTPKQTQSADGNYMPLASSPVDATNKLEAHAEVYVKTAGKQENKDYVYAVVHKDIKVRDSVASFYARKACSKHMEPVICPNSAVESANRSSFAPDPANHSDARCSSVEDLSHSQDALAGEEEKEYLYAVVDKANTKKRPPQKPSPYRGLVYADLSHSTTSNTGSVKRELIMSRQALAQN